MFLLWKCSTHKIALNRGSVKDDVVIQTIKTQSGETPYRRVSPLCIYIHYQNYFSNVIRRVSENPVSLTSRYRYTPLDTATP